MCSMGLDVFGVAQNQRVLAPIQPIKVGIFELFLLVISFFFFFEKMEMFFIWI